MRSGLAATLGLDQFPRSLQAFLRRQIVRLTGLALLLAIVFATASLATWNVADPSFSHATGNIVTNAMGYPGAVFADIAMQFFGLGTVTALLPAVFWGAYLATARHLDRKIRRAGSWLASAVLFSAVIACVAPPATWPLPSGLGGVFGDMVLKLPALATGAYPSGWLAALLGALLLAPATWLFCFGAGIVDRQEPEADPEPARDAVEIHDDPLFEPEEEERGGNLLLGAVTHWWLSFRAFAGRRLIKRGKPARLREQASADEPPLEPAAFAAADGERVEPSFGGDPVPAPAIPVEGAFEDDFEGEDDLDDLIASRPAARVSQPAPRPKPGNRVSREAQASLIGSGEFEMPSLHFLAEVKQAAKGPSLSKDALEQNARLLEGVLEDFGVKGEIIHVRPGPVVTLYELEPAPGIKSSRVIGLADDIARSMSAIAARVAVVPGRNAIGIELPNATRETVFLRELLASRDYENMKAKLGLTLGKTINGEAVIADLAKMPHLLVAGTTGSGKSVAINTMILSLLYRLRPEECRLIMIDPKMLELSVYDGIPHLLTPVVTDPKKAVVALKWTVREMEDRYRKMSKLGVRNIDGFNQRVRQAEKKGERISRTVQTGFDRETGEAIYETEELDLTAMPYIVVIIDEMADLMMVAGKDIEGAVQRLAQMARAAGIHVIMATQRPSVDVITGTIKANFPTRISFQVTSKIDSRTILGEQGAEQLLGMGDMLYMAGGGRIQRVHGPFVSDDEVEKVVAHLKLQGVPQYLDAITEDDGEDEPGGGGNGGGMGDSDDPYDQAVAVVLRDGKASTSYIQRRLGIGYNRAASLIERMEDEGVIGPANHAGKREILVPTEEDKM
ncbi:MAG: DNA translocase FtsK [Rhizobiaceae bacterium]